MLFCFSVKEGVTNSGRIDNRSIMVFMGLLISVPIIVWGSVIILRWIEKYPVIVYLGSAVLAWTAGQMIVGYALIS